MKLVKLGFLLLSVIATLSCKKDNELPDNKFELEKFEPVSINKTMGKKIYMHYMTWFESAQSNDGRWGYHWTMANQNPDIIDSDGKRQIASHFYPLIGPYHSGDADVIEYHLLLMKYAGIDGILIDWYGTYDVNDYKMVKDNTDAVVDMVDEVGLEFAIVYEDRFLENIVNANMAPNKVSAAKRDMSFLESYYFSKDSYIEVDNKPLLLNFGPITLTQPDDWTQVFSNLASKPAFYPLWNHNDIAGAANTTGVFFWPYGPNTINDYYNSYGSNPVHMAGAYPGFIDFYEEGGTSTVIGWEVAHNNGATLNETLNRFDNSNADMLQLITWNDFGEGTIIEPTDEFGYDYLKSIRSFSGTDNVSDVFAQIKKLYDLRKEFSGNRSVQEKLDQVFYYFVSLQTEKAAELLNNIKSE